MSASLTEGRRHKAADYVGVVLFDDDDYATNITRKVVKTRAEHRCVARETHHMPAGTVAVVERGILPGLGRLASYACLDCLDIYLDKENAPYGAL